MPRPRLAIALAIALPGAAICACFPDYQVSQSGGTSSGEDGGSDATTSHDDGSVHPGDDSGSLPGQDGSLPGQDGGSGSDGATTGDAAGWALVPRTSPQQPFVYVTVSNSQTSVNVTHDVYIDKREVTVGEFKQWLAAQRPTPQCGGNAICSLDPGGPHDNRIVWNHAWDNSVAVESYKNGNCDQTVNGVYTGRSTYLGGDDTVPMSCVNWYQAVAFCWWSGARRLPTLVEWQYEASGRGQGRTYPWGDTPAPSDCSRAVWRADGGSPDYNGCGFPKPPGSAPLGASIDGVLDMAGSVAEWIWDVNDNVYPQTWPDDYDGLSVLDAGAGGSKLSRGGSWSSAEPYLHVNMLDGEGAENTLTDLGFRCVKTKL